MLLIGHFLCICTKGSGEIKEMATVHSEQDLTVRPESIESAYRQYRQDRYIVNRRYQRKLIWTLEEKQGFIDSVMNGYPVPIILLAESARQETSVIEIIDGMQRLNAIFSFIENEYSVNGSYFDLETMASTKELLDAGKLQQNEPRLAREQCVSISGYSLPISIFEFANQESVDEVFRRINSGGRKLSRQELRTAGAIGHFATCVRKIATSVRGDSSYSDILPLNRMAAISITNRELPYGIHVDDIFWVKQNILTKEQVRESRDEEIIADIIAYMVSDDPPSSRSEFFDDYFGIISDEPSRRRFDDVETAIQRRSVELVTTDFIRCINELKLILSQADQTFGRLLFDQQPARAPRYFQVVFLALYTLCVKEGLKVSDRTRLIAKMTNQAATIPVPEGGRWGGEDRHNAIQAAAGVYRECFVKDDNQDPATIHWVTQFENLLAQSETEQTLFDFKQGFLRLDGSSSFDEPSFEKILKTLVGIANHKKGAKGYVIVGVADSPADAARVAGLYNVNATSFMGKFVTGIDHEVSHISKDLENLFKDIIRRIEASAISEPLRSFVARNIIPIKYYDKTVFILTAIGQDDPSNYGGEFFERVGPQLREVKAEDLTAFIRRYIS